MAVTTKILRLAFELTAAGMTQRDQILQSCFAFFALLRQQPFPLELFQERQRLLQWSFTYQEPRATLQLASDLAVNLQHYPQHDYIFGDYRMEAPPESLYRQLLGFFRADNLRVMLIAPEVAVEPASALVSYAL